MRKLLAAVVALVLVVIGGGALFVRWLDTQGSPTGKTIKVSIPTGTSGSTIADALQKRGVVRSSLAFRLYLKTSGVTGGLKAGQYDLRSDMPFPELVNQLEMGPAVKFVKLVVPEGLNIDQTAAQVDKLTHVSAADFLAAATPATVRPGILPENVSTLEGFLYPTTYFIEEKDTPESVVKRIVGQFNKQFQKQDVAKATELGRTPYEILIIASMIEEEAKADDERTKVSAVIHNRLKQGIALGIDATTQYLVRKYNGQPLTQSDLEIDSPFNTRKRAGLPPTPISSPRASSINAALNPASEDYLYYVLGSDCVHHVFTNNSADFIRAKARQPRNC
ncbi:MAG: endolytic transglycosylase MltG [Actinomycetota bacterium]